MNNETSLATKLSSDRAAFYRTYDVMIGVRIAATLGGFFIFMVLLLLYKSKCKNAKSIHEEQIAMAVAVAAVAAASENEGSPVGLYSLAPRMSLGNFSAPTLPHLRTPRFSSIGGYVSLEASTCLYPSRSTRTTKEVLENSPHLREPLPHLSTLHYPPSEINPRPSITTTSSSVNRHYLDVPRAVRRLSSITCSSSDTSYLERRGSAIELGLPAPPPYKNSMAEPWDFYYPIDIQVIQPTPKGSPCTSEHTLCSRPQRGNNTGLLGVAPLASITTCGGGTGEDPSGCSLGSDSVFTDDLPDTEDEVDGFSTDSEGEAGSQVPPPCRQCQRRTMRRIPWVPRRLSAPVGVPIVTPVPTDAPSRSCDPIPLPQIGRSTTGSDSPTLRIPVNKWSQETLF